MFLMSEFCLVIVCGFCNLTIKGIANWVHSRIVLHTPLTQEVRHLQSACWHGGLLEAVREYVSCFS